MPRPSRTQSLSIFGLGALSFAIATAADVLFTKFLNLFTRNRMNPLLGAVGVSAVPDSARVVRHGAPGRHGPPRLH